MLMCDPTPLPSGVTNWFHIRNMMRPAALRASLSSPRQACRMRRNLELIRQIALKVEESESDPLGWLDIAVEGFTNEQVSYQIMLMHEAGLLVGQDLSDSEGLSWHAKRLTWAGHEFAEAARDQNIWQKAMQKINGALSGVSFAVLNQVLAQLALRALGIAA